MFMPNIPRRKIYETMLEFEDGMIEMQILLFNNENYNQFIEKFNDNAIKKMSNAYFDIKALLVMFLENTKYKTNEEFEKELQNLKNDNVLVNSKIKKNKNLKISFKFLIYRLDKIMQKVEKIDSYEHGKKIYKILDKFNHSIPKILELRRDMMK